jgi:CheY-like chemotaxis protein
MAHKILVADDSQTIQKVIAITLAAEPYQITQAGNETQLMNYLEGDFDLIIFDFNLSDDVSGYELTKNIKLKANDSVLLAMLGTFDSVDDEKLKNHGANDSIVKPFESSDFIAKCAYLTSSKALKTEVASTFPNTPAAAPHVALPPAIESTPSINSEDNWEISSPAFDQEFHEEKSGVDFRSELSDWVGPLPGVIGAKGKEEMLPPIIHNDFEDDEPTGSFELPQEFRKEATHKAPTAEDLEYPDSFGAESTGKTGLKLATETKGDEDSFWAIDEIDKDKAEFSIEDHVGEEVEAKAETKFDDAFLYDTPVSASDLEKEIFDQISKEEITASFDEYTEDPADHTGEIQVAGLQSEESAYALNEDEIVEKLMIKLIPLVREEIKKYCEKNVDKVAWEVIPDLAENLIKKEITQISSSVK